jgi:hypothetical protein
MVQPQPCHISLVNTILPTILPTQSFLHNPSYTIFLPTQSPEMAVSLTTYLQRALPPLPLLPPHAGDNTQNAAYHWVDIGNIGVWVAFNLNTIQTQYQTLMNATRLQPDRMPLSPRKPINAENTIKNRISELVHPRARRGLREGFATLVRLFWKYWNDWPRGDNEVATTRSTVIIVVGQFYNY